MQITATRFFSPSEQAKLFATIAEHSDKAAQIDFVLFQLLALSGLRISEALALKWSDIGEGFLIIQTQKNGTKKGTVLIGTKLVTLLRNFAQANPYAESSYLFNTRKGPYKRTNAHDRLKHWLELAGVRSSLSLHSFRHTYATTSLNAGLPLTLVRDQLRHSNIAVTSAYLHFT